MKLSGSRLIRFGAIIALIGFIFSGPLGFLIVQTSVPQPQWASSVVFAKNYSVLQNLPYYAGFILLGGMLVLFSAHYLGISGQTDEKRLPVLLSVLCTCIFSALISFNYICQVSFLHHLALNYKPEYDMAISTYSMANPMSLCWSMEIWGYGILGVATWLMSSFYRHKSRPVYLTLILNGIVSVACIPAAIIDTGWLLKGAGLAAYFAWNILMITLLILIYRYNNKQTVS